MAGALATAGRAWGQAGRQQPGGAPNQPPREPSRPPRAQIGNTDCSAEEDPEACEEMVSKTGVIANSMKAKALYCEC